MGTPAGIVMFSFAAVVLLGSAAGLVLVARRRGRRLEFLDISIQVGGLLFVLAATVELPRAAKIAIGLAAYGVWLYAIWGHIRRAARGG